MIDISQLTEHSVNVNGFNSNPNIHGHAKKVLQKINQFCKYLGM